MYTRFIEGDGIEYVSHGQRLIARLTLCFNGAFSREDSLNYGRILSNYTQAVVGRPHSVPSHSQPSVESEVTLDTFQESMLNSALKFVPQRIAKLKLSNGAFKLANLEHFRSIEFGNNDPQEGIANFLIRTPNYTHSIQFLAGFEYYIMSLSRPNLTLAEFSAMSMKYGPACFQIMNISSFAERIAEKIGAIEVMVQEIKYSDFKQFSIQLPDCAAEEDYDSLIRCNFETILNHSKYPGLFMKPSDFESEHEVRIAFKMQKRLPLKAELHFTDKSLIKHLRPVRAFEEIF